MRQRDFIACILGLLISASLARGGELEEGFAAPPDWARPWVYWFWLDGNITRVGISADLEAMKRAGIGGVLIMEVDQGAPKGPARFGSPQWRELFQFVCSEAHRLGLEVNMNNDAGWCGSGGPWITPELSMQKVVWSETRLEGGKRFDGTLPKPQAVRGFYRDIAVLAVPVPAGAESKIPDIQGKASFETKHYPTRADWPATAPETAIPRQGIMDVTGQMDSEGKLGWEAPPGKWLVLRFGHTTTGKENSPAPQAGRGLECDKFSKEAAEAMFKGLMGNLISDSKPLAGTGKTLVSTHIDSWEVGSQNWTPLMRKEFQKLRGYDILPFLPVLTGRVVDSMEISERFLWDLRQTVSDLIVSNYAGHFRELAHQHGLRLSIEAYDGVPCDEMTYAGQADEPMAEFWSWDKYSAAYSCTEMSSAAHVYGKPILGAEAFTATDAEKWLGHPAIVKDLGDWAFCEGINRFVFHRYALQPWPDRRPGMSMGPWGLHYERTQTWWGQAKAWHEYLARCQYLLQQGLFVADVCYLQAEGAPRRFAPPAGASTQAFYRSGYNFDGCTPEVVLTRMKVQDGLIVLPDGMSYRVLVLPEAETMTPTLLRKIRDLVRDGATVIGAGKMPPRKAPGLSDFPHCDQEVAELARDLWEGGKLLTGKTAAQVLSARGVPPDFAASRPLRYIHRRLAKADVYFVANGGGQSFEVACTFRAGEKRPELWHPETGSITPLTVFDQAEGCTRIPLRFGPTEAVFVVFRKEAKESERVVSITRDGAELLPAALPPSPSRPREGVVSGTFSMTVWVNPETDTPLPPESNSGATAYMIERNDALYPAPGHEVWTDADAGAGIAAGRNGVCVHEHGANYFPAPLVFAAEIKGWTHLAVVYRDNQPSLYVNGKFAKTGLKSALVVHPSVGAPHQRAVAAFRGQMSGLQQFARALSEAEIEKLAQAAPPPPASDVPALDFVRYEATSPGNYVIKTGDGRSRQQSVEALPAPIEIAGAWEVSFAPGAGAPEKITLEKLLSWSEHSDAGVKYYSGPAVYRKSFALPAKLLASSRRWHLDLGRVAVMAEVKVNGKEFGVLWKAPFRVDVTEALKEGDNALEVRVVNLWISRMIGDEQLPEDSERNSNGTLKKWPEWLVQEKPSPTGRFTFTSWRLWKKTDKLAESGLLGPVMLRPVARLDFK